MKLVIIVILFIISFLFSCNNDGERKLVGTDSEGLSYQLTCESNVEKCNRKPAIKIEYVFNNVSEKLLICCRDIEQVLDKLDTFKLNLAQFPDSNSLAGSTITKIDDFTILENRCTDAENRFCFFIYPRYEQRAGAGLTFFDSTKLNQFRSLLDSIYIPCCLN